MSLRAWWSRVRGSLRRDDTVEREMEQEMAFHVEMSARRNVERGMPPEAARRQAKLAFGSEEAFKEGAREASRARVAEELISDIRFAARSLGRSPSFTAAAILTVALGIGTSTAIFTVVNAVLLRPLPIPQPEDFAYVGWVWGPKGNHVPALTDFKYEFVRDHSRALMGVATYRTHEAHLGDESGAQPLRGLRASGDLFRTIGFSPRLGRKFDPRELEAGGPAVVILGDDVWRTRYGGDPGILGRRVRLDGEPHTVVGILPPEFRFPPAIQHTAYVVPLAVRPDPTEEGHNTNVIGRLRHDMSERHHAADMRALSGAFRATYPSVADSGYFHLYTHGDVYVGNAARHTLWVLFGAVSLVLLIACANTATLLLVRASARQREIAVRASIGAGPARILQQLLTEGLVVSLMAATLGVFLSVIAVRGFLAVAPNALPAGADPSIDVRVLTFAIGVSVVTGLIFGLVAAVPAYRRRLQSMLVGGTRGATVGSTRLREGLVFLETAVAIVLLCGATLLIASFTRLIRVDPGFDGDRVTAVRLGRLPPEYDAARRDQLVDRLLERVRALAGVEHAAAAPSLPLERGLNWVVDIAERPDLARSVELRYVSPDYLATLGVPLLGGRDFDDNDVAGAEPVAIVNESFARHFWGDATPLGRTIQIGHFRDQWRADAAMQHQTRVIGVAADIREIGLDRAAKATVLVPRAQSPGDTPLLLVRGTAPALLGTLRDAVLTEEPRLTPEVERLSAVVSRSVAEPRFRTLLVGAFAGFALLLAGIGIYGVIASVVQQRWREIGIRLALGATGAGVSAVVARRCLANVAAGALAGLLAFWATRRVLASWLYETAPGDPRMLTLTVVAIVIVAALASWIPARRAARIDPATSLRLE